MSAMADLQARAAATVLAKAAEIDAWWEGVFGPVNPLSASMPLVAPRSVAGFGLAYIAFVLVVPLLFRVLRFSIKLKPVMRIYNLFMVVLSAYMGTKSILLASQSNSSLWCVPLAKGRPGEEMATLVWIFTFSKVVEFLDTIFMIVEGRMRQVSFLHVYHHVSIFPYWFAILWISPGSDAYFSLAGNSYIHVLMYSYYLLASFGYSPWWKYYITKAQIFQFCCFCAQSVYVGYMKKESECDFPHILARGLLWYMLTLIALFMHFLLTNAGKKRKSRPSDAGPRSSNAGESEGKKIV
jgi:elongation of very long chain fatty acids protein 4